MEDKTKKDSFKVKVHLKGVTLPVEFANVDNTLMSEGMYCIDYLEDNCLHVQRFPMSNVMTVIEYEEKE